MKIIGTLLLGALFPLLGGLLSGTLEIVAIAVLEACGVLAFLGLLFWWATTRPGPAKLSLPRSQGCPVTGEGMRPLEVLLIEDSLGDVALVRAALTESPASIHLSVAHDGAQALAFLHRQGPYARAPRPDVLLLDLQLPYTSGRAVLQALHGDQTLHGIPVIILSASTEEHDIVQSQALGARSYYAKPLDLDQFIAMVGAGVAFWGTQATPAR
jgi:two-component system, chemotaxis family, response regulator Rcp1